MNTFACSVAETWRHQNLETSVHLFLTSDMGGDQQLSAVPGLHPGAWTHLKLMEDWFPELVVQHNLNAGQKKGVRSLTILVCWIIWKERNARIFYANERSPSCLVREIKNEARLWCQAGNKTLTRSLVYYIASNSLCNLPA
jgi:hypothetical protein